MNRIETSLHHETLLAMAPILAQNGVGDVPSIMLLLLLSLWPQHLYCALSSGYAPQLVGYGPAAILLQSIGLLLFVISALLIVRSRKRHLSVKLLMIVALYMATVFGTNLAPSLFPA